jgi:hypothetical protein
MTGTEILQSVQFVTIKGKRFAVLSLEDWEAMIEWLETIEDIQVAQQAYTQLKAAGGDRKQAHWLEWRPGTIAR